MKQFISKFVTLNKNSLAKTCFIEILIYVICWWASIYLEKFSFCKCVVPNKNQVLFLQMCYPKQKPNMSFIKLKLSKICL